MYQQPFLPYGVPTQQPGQQQFFPTQQPSQPFLPGTPMPTPPGFAQQPQIPGILPLEQSYIENILRLNLGKVGTFYMTYENNNQWNAKIFKGIVDEAGRDHIILRDPQSEKQYLLLMVNLDYVTFDEPLEYDLQPPSQLATYSPR